MTTGALLSIGASSADLSWDAIDWQTTERCVRRLQMRIAKATRARSWGKVQALQQLLLGGKPARNLLKANGGSEVKPAVCVLCRQVLGLDG